MSGHIAKTWQGTHSPLFCYHIHDFYMIAKEKVEAILQECIDSAKEFVVELSVSPSNKILVLIDSDEGISIDRCVAVSREIEQHFDREVDDFELEVSSAGLSSPLKMARQYHKNVGRSLDVVLNDGLKMSGKLVQVNEDGFSLEVEEMVKEEGMKRKKLQVRTVSIKYDEVKTATVVISYR